MTNPSRPVRLLAAGASVVFTLCLLGLVEFVAGFIAEPIHHQEIPGDTVSRTVTWLELNPAPLVRDADLLWRNEPGARKTQLVNPQHYGRRDEWTIENNSEGFRGPERAASAEGDDVFRVLCVGDSITFGFSVDQRDSYPEQLSRELGRRHPGRRMEFINAGVPGWSWLQGLRFLDLRAAELDPDLIVIGHGTNDQFFPAKITDEERFVRLSSPLEKLKQRLALFAVETNVYRALSGGLRRNPGDVESRGCKEQTLLTGACRRVALDQIAAAVRGIGDVAEDLGVGLLVVNTDFVQTPAVRGLRQGVEETGVPFVDLVGEFERRRAEDEAARSVRLGLAAPGAAPAGARQVVFRVLVPDASLPYRVAGQAYFRPDFTFAEALHDDGTHGDEKAGDGVFSATIPVPDQYAVLQYKYFQGEIAEFAALPPLASTLGDRVLQLPESRFGPVDVFGASLFMVERAHPNRDGHQLIAQLLADKIGELPLLRSSAQPD